MIVDGMMVSGPTDIRSMGGNLWR